MSDILLDPNGDVPVPDGYHPIESEVEFLRQATTGRPLLIRGGHLCAWAESFYRLRGHSCRFVESLVTLLRRIFPELSSEQAVALVRTIGKETASSDEISAQWVLAHCYPDATALWYGTPSREHAAKWLLWLCTRKTDPAISVVLRSWAGQMDRQSGDAPEAALYQAGTYADARQLLQSWLGLNGKSVINLNEFPLSLPDNLLQEIKREWNVRLIESNGDYFTQMLAFPLSNRLRQELAQLAAAFYQHNPRLLTQDRLQQLAPYVNDQIQQDLRQVLPPPEPTDPPVHEEDVLQWFLKQYLPYRRWQAQYGDSQTRDQILRYSQAFARWYLEKYPDWLLSPESAWLSFQKVFALHQDADYPLTLCVILDGLPAWDAEDFVTSLSAHIERLQLQQRLYCFAPLPTVTEFAKDALLKGVPPKHAPDYPPLGTVLPDNASPANELKSMQAGLVFWRIRQPDDAYHFETEARRQRKIRAELDAVLQAIVETVEAVPSSTPFYVVITTDHGRLCNPRSSRRLNVPAGMEAHGRVVWGKLDQRFDEDGFKVEEKKGWIAVHGERFGMAHDMLIALGEESFQQATKGDESYPHGGLFPEEAIVPWLVFERDAKQPELLIALNGKGEAGGKGTVEVTITNPAKIALECLAITLSHGAEVRGMWFISPLQKSEFTVSLSPWPTNSDVNTLTATLLLRQPNGKTFTQVVTPTLEVSYLYDKQSLEDLGL